MWFRRDLRLGDNPALVAAAAEGDVVAVFVVDPAFDRAGRAPTRVPPRLPDRARSIDPRRRRDRARHPRRRSGRARSRRWRRRSMRRPCSSAATTGRTAASAMPRWRRDCRTPTVSLRGVGSPYAVPPGEVRKDDGTPYAVFTPFSKAWRRVGWDAPVDDRLARGHRDGRRPTGPTTALRAARSRDAQLPVAGEPAAHDRWREFLPRRASTGTPNERNLPAVDGTSRLSPALRWGTIHPRQLLVDLDTSGAGERAHTVFSSELAWRDFYADVLFQRPETAWQNLDRKMDRHAGRHRSRRAAALRTLVPRPRPGSGSSTPGCTSWRPPAGCTTGCA